MWGIKFISEIHTIGLYYSNFRLRRWLSQCMEVGLVKPISKNIRLANSSIPLDLWTSVQTILSPPRRKNMFNSSTNLLHCYSQHRMETNLLRLYSNRQFKCSISCKLLCTRAFEH